MGYFFGVKRGSYTLIILILISVQAFLLFQHCERRSEPVEIAEEDPFQPEVAKALLDGEYAGTESCIECHEKEYNEYAKMKNLPMLSELLTFEQNYHKYFGGWRFWLLP